MSRSGDGPEDMRRDEWDDAATEAALRVPPAAGTPDSVAAFVEDVRRFASGPRPVPSDLLRTAFRDGWATAAPAEDGPDAVVLPFPHRRRKRTLAEAIGGMGLAGKILLGGAAAAFAVTGAAATNSLPPSAQHVVSRALDAVTPFHVPDPQHEAADDPARDRGGNPGAGRDGGPSTTAGPGAAPTAPIVPEPAPTTTSAAPPPAPPTSASPGRPAPPPTHPPTTGAPSQTVPTSPPTTKKTTPTTPAPPTTGRRGPPTTPTTRNARITPTTRPHP